MPPSPADGMLMATTPANPTATPNSCAPEVRVRKKSTPKSAVKIGMAPLSMPVTAELMCCSAMGNNVKGMATHNNESAMTRTRSPGWVVMRGPGSRLSISAPSPTRRRVSVPGLTASRPMEMNRNDAPQIPAIERNSAQSVATKA